MFTALLFQTPETNGRWEIRTTTHWPHYAGTSREKTAEEDESKGNTGERKGKQTHMTTSRTWLNHTLHSILHANIIYTGFSVSHSQSLIIFWHF